MKGLNTLYHVSYFSNYFYLMLSPLFLLLVNPGQVLV